MSTDLIETSDALGEPLELYRFTYGSGASVVTHGYVDGDFEVIFGSDIYMPAFVERQAITASGSLDKADLEVRVAGDSAIADEFRGQPPADVVGLTIFRCHYDPDVDDITTPMAVWTGRVLGCSREDSEAKLSCESAVTSLRRVGLRRHYQYMCPHLLYGPLCRAQRADHTGAVTIAAVGSRSVSVTGDLGQQYAGGILTWTPLGEPEHNRTVVRVTFDAGTGRSVLTLAGAPVGISAGDTADLARGCQHTLANCRDVFSNAPNFGGMPFIPTKNPHGSTAIYN